MICSTLKKVKKIIQIKYKNKNNFENQMTVLWFLGNHKFDCLK